MAQGVPRWCKKLETGEEPELAILILNAILFLISHVAPLHYCFYFTSLMGKWLRRTFSVRQWASRDQIPNFTIIFFCLTPLHFAGVRQQKLRADFDPVSTCFSCSYSLI